MADELEWRDTLPQKRKRRTETDDIVSQLKERPGQWARVEWTPFRNSGIKKKYVDRGCEVAQRIGDEGVNVWARWPDPEDWE